MARHAPSLGDAPNRRNVDADCTDARGCATLRAARMPTAHSAPALHRGDSLSLR